MLRPSARSVLVAPVAALFLLAACTGSDATATATDKAVREVRPVEASPVALARPDRGAVAFQLAAPAAAADAEGDWGYRIEAERTACIATPEPTGGNVAPGTVATAQWDLTFEAGCAASVPHLLARVQVVRGDRTATYPVLVYATATGRIRTACLGVATELQGTCRTRGATVVIGSTLLPAEPSATSETPPTPALRSEPVAARVVVNDAADGDDTLAPTPDADVLIGGSGDNTITVDAGDVVVGTGTDAVTAAAGFVDVADGTPDDRVECTQAGAVEVIADAGDEVVGECVLDTTPDDAEPGATERGLLGNYTVTGVINLDICKVATCSTPGYPPQNERYTVTVTLSDGRNCTKNETGQGSYTVTSNGFKIPLSFTARNEWDSTCAYLLSGAGWKIDVKSQTGKVVGAGIVYLGQFGRSYFAGADYIMSCGSKASSDTYWLELFADEGQLPPNLGCSRTKDLANFRIVRAS